MSPPIYQYAIKLFVKFWEAQVLLWTFRYRKIVLQTTRILFGKVFYSNTVIFSILMWNLISICRFDNILYPHFCIKISL
jgi:hypothetical protein